MSQIDTQIKCSVFSKGAVEGTALILGSLKNPYNAIKGEANKTLDKLMGEIQSLHVTKMTGLYSVERRIKSLESLARKSWVKAWTKPFRECKDLLGLRLICLLQGDIMKAKGTLCAAYPSAKIRRNLSDKDETGYRGVHLEIQLGDCIQCSDEMKDLQCEIQIRSVVQHCVAVLAHAIFYKSDTMLPKGIVSEQSQDIFAMFRVIDLLFSYLQDELMETTRSVNVSSRFNRSNLAQSLQTLPIDAIVDTSDPKIIGRTVRRLQDRGFTTIGDFYYALDVLQRTWMDKPPLSLNQMLIDLDKLLMARAKG